MFKRLTNLDIRAKIKRCETRRASKNLIKVNQNISPENVRERTSLVMESPHFKLNKIEAMIE